MKRLLATPTAPPQRSFPFGAATAVAFWAVAAVPHASAELDLRFDPPNGPSISTTPSNVWLHVGRGASPHPLLRPGPFTATWSGLLTVDLRGDYRFHAELEPPETPFQLEINGQPIPLSLSRDSEPVRLRKGTNSLRAVIQRRGSDTVKLRLLWQGRGLPLSPIPHIALARTTSTPEAPTAQPLRGRGLFLTHRCGKCHTVDVPQPVPELTMDAPRFDGIGSIRSREWMRRLLLDPRAAGPHATMPRLLWGPDDTLHADAIAAWLETLRSNPPLEPAGPGHAAAGKAIAERLLCTSCHRPADDPGKDDRIPWDGLKDRFVQARQYLPHFLRQPAANYAWTRMPTYRLTPEEANHLAEWLVTSSSTPHQPRPAPSAPATPQATTAETKAAEIIARGKELVETLGCLRCHTGPAVDRSQFKPLAQLPPDAWRRGCLSGTPPEPMAPPRPDYSFSPQDLADLRAFGSADPGSLGRHVPADFAERWMTNLRCSSCHGANPALPSLVHAGEKLRPEWMERQFAGGVEIKPRTWLPASMPAFPAFAKHLAQGMAARHGMSPTSPAEPPIDLTAAADGRKLVSASGGLACVTCHAVGPMGASAVFEAPGINLARVADRLLPEYFARWVRNPQLLEPETKMPLYFDEDGNTALADFYGGDGPKTIHALWNYIRLGSRMEPPPP